MKKKLILIGGLFVVLLILAISIYTGGNNKPSKEIVIPVATESNVDNNNDKTQVSKLDTLQDGVILIYDNSCSNCEILKNSFKKVSDTYQVENITLNIDNAKDKEELDGYYKKHEKEIEILQKMKTYADKLQQRNFPEVKVIDDQLVEIENKYGVTNLTPDNKDLEKDVLKEYNRLLAEYKMTAKNVGQSVQDSINQGWGKITQLKQENGGFFPEDKKEEVYKVVTVLSDLQILTKEEILDYLLLLDQAPKSNLIISEEIKEFPTIIVAYQGTSINQFSGDRLPPNDYYKAENIENIEKYLTSAVGIINFQKTDEINQLEQKIANKESFLIYFHGNQCPHCLKMNPILDKIATEENANIFKVDMYLLQNQKEFRKLHEKGIDISDIETTPTFIAIENGIESKIVTSESWASQNGASELGYDIKEDIIRDLIKKYADKN